MSNQIWANNANKYVYQKREELYQLAADTATASSSSSVKITTWGTNALSRGDFIDYESGNFTFLEPGVYSIEYTVGVDATKDFGLNVFFTSSKTSDYRHGSSLTRQIVRGGSIGQDYFSKSVAVVRTIEYAELLQFYYQIEYDAAGDDPTLRGSDSLIDYTSLRITKIA